jgi:replicative DNA helicase
MANVSRIPMDKDHVSKLSPEEMVIPIKAASEIAKLPIFIRDDLYDLTAIVAVAKQFKQKRNIGLFIVDYAQLIRGP